MDRSMCALLPPPEAPRRFFFLYSLESGLEISRISPSLARGAMCETPCASACCVHLGLGVDLDGAP